MTLVDEGTDAGIITVPAPVSSAFCKPYALEFTIVEKALTFCGGRFSISDNKGTLLYNVKRYTWGWRPKRVFLDSAGNVLILVTGKMVSLTHKWHAYRGIDCSVENELFTISKAAVWQLRPLFNVFLKGNNSEHPDFIVRGDFLEHNFTVLYKNTVIAEVKKKLSALLFLVGKQEYDVTVHAGVDHVFIAALVIMMDQGQKCHKH